MSPKLNTRSTMARSVSSNVPKAVPSAIMIFISSSVTPWSAGSFIFSVLSTNSVDVLSNRTNGKNSLEKIRIGIAIADAIGSGLLSAIFFGTSSPKISEK